MYRVPVDAKGLWHGNFVGYWPGGKKVKEKSQYQNGDLEGVRQLFDQDGKLTADQTWHMGKLICPKSIQQIKEAKVRLSSEAAMAVEKLGSPSNPNAPAAAVLSESLAKLNFYRYLADVPPDVIYDNDYINLCQYASELLTKIGHLTHTPERPAGIDDKTYKLGKDGCGRSNLAAGSGAVGSIDMYMNDSDKSNIDRLGHRRWVINPQMQKTGIGQAGKFSALYSFDGSRESKFDYEFVCFPPRGYCPVTNFAPDHAWHVTVNPSKYKLTDSAALAIYPVDAKLKRGAELELDYKNVNRDGFGVGNAIIARPKGLVMKPNNVFEVVVSGVEDKEGKPATIRYYVSFY
jgi:hypothetical protein